MGEASRAAFAGGAIPFGWNVVTPAQLGIAPQYRNGNYFTDPATGASAIVLQHGNEFIVSFRGTDGADDINQYPNLVSGTYINNFQPLLSAVANATPAGTQVYFTGASLGGGATNLMANIAQTQYGGHFAGAKFVAFASPNISNANGILNVGFENDPIYKAINNYGDFASSLDNLVYATPEYMAGNYDGRHPNSTYAHGSFGALDALNRVTQSVFSNQMTPDSVIILDAASQLVQDITPGRENTGAFYIGEAIDDQISGRNGNDYLEGFGGNDRLNGGGGNDFLAGGTGDDRFIFAAGFGADVITDFMAGGSEDKIDVTAFSSIRSFGDVLALATQSGADTVINFSNGDTLTLQGVVKGNLTGDDFVGLSSIPSRNDLDGDGKSDILWRDNSGLDYAWLMNGLGIKAEGALRSVDTSWHLRGSGDFDGNGKSDILWQQNGGQVYLWSMDSTTVRSEGALRSVDASWHIQGIGDFNADGRDDVLWRQDGGQVYLWGLDGTSIKAEGGVRSVDRTWHIRDTGDFDGDGKGDILWQHDGGQVYLWTMNGSSIKGERAVRTVDTTWHIESAGDFDGDGKDDVLWRHEDGQVYVWLMDGFAPKAEGALRTVDSSWHIQGTGDYSGDGKDDILWQQDGGQTYIWEMNGLSILGEGAQRSATSNWHIVGHDFDLI
jgi:hypothetical protein